MGRNKIYLVDIIMPNYTNTLFYTEESSNSTIVCTKKRSREVSQELLVFFMARTNTVNHAGLANYMYSLWLRSCVALKRIMQWTSNRSITGGTQSKGLKPRVEWKSYSFKTELFTNAVFPGELLPAA